MFTYNGINYLENEKVTITSEAFNGITGYFIGSKQDEKSMDPFHHLALIQIDSRNTVEVEFTDIKKDGKDYIILMTSEFGDTKLIHGIYGIRNFKTEAEMNSHIRDMDRGIAISEKLDESVSDISVELHKKIEWKYEALPLDELQVSVSFNDIPLDYKLAEKLKSRLIY